MIEQTYIFKCLLYLDILAGSLLWRDPGMTISTRCGLALREPSKHNAPWRWLGRALNWLQKDHCEQAIQGDILRAQQTVNFLRSQNFVNLLRWKQYPPE